MKTRFMPAGAAALLVSACGQSDAPADDSDAIPDLAPVEEVDTTEAYAEQLRRITPDADEASISRDARIMASSQEVLQDWFECMTTRGRDLRQSLNLTSDSLSTSLQAYCANEEGAVRDTMIEAAVESGEDEAAARRIADNAITQGRDSAVSTLLTLATGQ